MLPTASSGPYPLSGSVANAETMAQRHMTGASTGAVGYRASSSPIVRDRSHDLDDSDEEDLRVVRRLVVAAAVARENAGASSVRLKVVELNTSDTSPVDVRKTQGRDNGKHARHSAVAVAGGDAAVAASRGQPAGDAEKTCSDDATTSGSGSASASSTGSDGSIDSSDDPDKVAYSRPGPKSTGPAGSSAAAQARPERPLLYYTTGDAVLRAGVRHAVRALGVYKVVDGSRTEKMERTVDHQRFATPAVFVVGRRPRRSVRLLLSMAQGAWVVRDTWLLDSLTARCWKPCEDYVPTAFPGVVAAHNSKTGGVQLLKGLRIGYVGDLNIAVDEFIQLVEAAGGCFTNLCVEVLVRGADGDNLLPGGVVPVVNQRWLPDSIARWECLPFDDYAGSL